MNAYIKTMTLCLIQFKVYASLQNFRIIRIQLTSKATLADQHVSEFCKPLWGLQTKRQPPNAPICLQVSSHLYLAEFKSFCCANISLRKSWNLLADSSWLQQYSVWGVRAALKIPWTQQNYSNIQKYLEFPKYISVCGVSRLVRSRNQISVVSRENRDIRVPGVSVINRFSNCAIYRIVWSKKIAIVLLPNVPASGTATESAEWTRPQITLKLDSKLARAKWNIKRDVYIVPWIRVS